MSPVTAWISRRISYIGLFLLVMCCVMLINQQSPNNNESNQSSQQQHLHQSNTAKEGGKWVQMEHCSCQRYIQVNNNNSNDNNAIPYNDTTCSTDAYERGSGQKVIGFSFYGDINTDYSKKKGYFEGITGNLALMPTYYPGWIMRLYFDLDPEDPIMKDLCQVACQADNLDLCHAAKLPGTPMKDARKVFPMNWRFFPTLDPQVDVYACRDLDSRFSEREYFAVNDWLHSQEPLHSMRDHPAHLVPLLGASWGCHMAKKNARARWRKSWMKMLKDPLAWADRSLKGPDQDILKKYIWVWGRHSSIQHDSYLCKTFRGSQPFPTQRINEPNNFIASVFVDNATLWKKCPPACRPKEHQDWEHC